MTLEIYRVRTLLHKLLLPLPVQFHTLLLLFQRSQVVSLGLEDEIQPSIAVLLAVPPLLHSFPSPLASLLSRHVALYRFL